MMALPRSRRVRVYLVIALILLAAETALLVALHQLQEPDRATIPGGAAVQVTGARADQ